MPGDLGEPRGDYARVLCFISHARLRVRRAPGIPHALCFQGRRIHAQLRRIAPRERGVAFDEYECATQCVAPANAGTHNHRSPFGAEGVGHPAKTRVRGVWVPACAGTTVRLCIAATRWLAMTISD